MRAVSRHGEERVGFDPAVDERGVASRRLAVRGQIVLFQRVPSRAVDREDEEDAVRGRDRSLYGPSCEPSNAVGRFKWMLSSTEDDWVRSTMPSAEERRRAMTSESPLAVRSRPSDNRRGDRRA